jgi:phosphoribosylanthranilate isomerase
MIRIKICGITRYEDARLAANLGADALGFIFYKKSPRFIAPSAAKEIIRKLPPFITRVGVFIDEEPSAVAQTIVAAGLDTVQFHGDESPEYCRRFACSVIKAFSVQPGFDTTALDSYSVSGFLLDTWDAKARGGTGKTFDWETAKLLTARRDNIILAGGLGPSNLAEALEIVHPYAVDLNSGVEIRPGEKNPQKLRDAIAIVKNWK